MKLFSVVIVFASICCFNCADNNADSKSLEAQWEKYKVEFKKNYDNKENEMRYKLFLEALEDIKRHNEKFKKGEVDVEATPNEYSDWTYDEKKKLLE